MNGKALGIIIVIIALTFGALVYYTQLYAFYEELPASTEMHMTKLTSGTPEAIIIHSFTGIDATSSPLRFRSCFTTDISLAMLAETYQTYAGATPLTAPGWFDCFDALAIGAALEQGQAHAFLGQANIHEGVDRVIAVFPDGRAFAWHQLNEQYAE